MKRFFVLLLSLVFIFPALPSAAQEALPDRYGMYKAADRASVIRQEVLGGKAHPQRVLVLNFDPKFPMAKNKRQHDLIDWWNDPHTLAKQYITAMSSSSHGNAQYTIAEWIDIDELPKAVKGRGYTLENYYTALKAASKQQDYWSSPLWKTFGQFDYDGYLTRYDVYGKVESGEIEEVWIFVGPMAGVDAYESLMIGRNAYWCNSPPMVRSDCPAFVCYVFNYERDVGCMLEDAGHRMESIMAEQFGWDTSKPISQMNDWELFTLYDKIAPGNAGCGNVHFAPNSDSDYDWGNSRKVVSTCKDWLKYPNLTGAKTMVTAKTWGSGDMAAHHKWWFGCIPHAKGVNEKSGKLNNWWLYFKYPDASEHPAQF